MERKNYLILMAGGSGTRMGAPIPKQFLELGGRAILHATLERFCSAIPDIKVVTVLPEAHIPFWRHYCAERNVLVPQVLVTGGITRFHSVRNGLAAIPDDAEGVVGIHDGVRPFPSVEVIRACYETARTAKAVIPVVPVVETVRHIVAGGKTETVDRADYRLVQTPQTFDIQLLKQAYAQPYRDCFTDDASVVESAGHEVTLIEGNRENIKITTPFDLRIARILA